jgi:EpsI family protein
MGKTKSLTLIAILLIPIAVSFGLPQIKYRIINNIKYLNIPLSIGNWLGKELPKNEEEIKNWDLNYKLYGPYLYHSYSFSKIKRWDLIYKLYGPNLYQSYSFSRRDGSQIYFSLLNAGFLHNPKTCYTGIGYKPRYEGTYNVILSKNNTLQFDSYLMLKKNNDLLTTYWMCIDGKKVNWLEQKLNELICSITGKKSINILARIDVPTNPNKTDKALAITKDFIRDLYKTLDKNKTVYIFGEKLP